MRTTQSRLLFIVLLFAVEFPLWTNIVVRNYAKTAPEVVEKRRRFVARCAEAGVRITAGSDGAGLGKRLQGFGLHHELASLRNAGLDGLAALRAPTIDAACVLGCSDSIGSVAAGKIADLLVTNANLMAAHLRPEQIERVLVRGTPHVPSDLLAIAKGTGEEAG